MPKNKKTLIIVAIFFLLAGYFLYMEEQGNFHQVTAGEAYRSAQLDRDEFEYYIKKYRIKSVVNLRGQNADAPWYKEETEACAAQNVRHFDIQLSATDEPKEEDIRRLIEIFISAPRPLLMHCQAGADRSGLAAAIWKVVVDHEPKSEARKQLSLLYGHIPIGKTTILDRYFEKWDPAAALKMSFDAMNKPSEKPDGVFRQSHQRRPKAATSPYAGVSGTGGNRP